MRTVKHRPMLVYRKQGAMTHPIIGSYSTRKQSQGWRQTLDPENDEGEQLSINSPLAFTERDAQRLHALMSLLDELFPTIFEIIDAEIPPFNGFNLNELEISGIHILEDYIDISFSSDACKDAFFFPEVRWDGVSFKFSQWTC